VPLSFALIKIANLVRHAYRFDNHGL